MQKRPTHAGWHRDAVRGGERWEDGKAQLDLLIGRGLRAEHRFLDIACGSFRLGVHAIPYLAVGHYYGVDQTQELLEAGTEQELKPRGLIEREPHLLCDGVFNFAKLGCSPGFDFAWAYSLFTHLRPPMILKCLRATVTVLAPTGRLLASFNESEPGVPENQGTEQVWPVHFNGCQYTISRMRALARQAGLSVERVPEWHLDAYVGRRHLQRMLSFQHVPA